MPVVTRQARGCGRGPGRGRRRAPSIPVDDIEIPEGNQDPIPEPPPDPNRELLTAFQNLAGIILDRLP